MDESGGNYDKRNEHHSQKIKLIETENRMVVARALGMAEIEIC
jgi:hypothetical protein